ncbi:hypothetical protein ACLOJK_028707 [Asimina triloba]
MQLLHKLLQLLHKLLQQLFYGRRLVITAAHQIDDHETPPLAGSQVLPPPQAPEAGGQIQPLPPQVPEGGSDGQEPDEAEQRRKIKGKEPLVASDDDDDDEEEIGVFPFQRDIASTSGTKNSDDAGKEEEEEEIAPTMPGNSRQAPADVPVTETTFELGFLGNINSPTSVLSPPDSEGEAEGMARLIFEEYLPRLNDIW